MLANFASVNLVMAPSFLKRVRIRIAWYRHVTGQGTQEFARPFWRRMLVHRAKALIFRTATHVVPVSEAAMRDANEVFGVPHAKCRVFHTCRPDPRTVLGAAYPERPIAGRIACIGRLYNSKGQDVVLHALHGLRQTKPQLSFSLDIVGGGPCEDALRALVQSLDLGGDVSFAGEVTHDEALRRIALAEILVVPVRSEAGPGVVPEGLGCGVPIVASDIAPIRELVGQSEAVCFVPPDDPEALAAAIGGILGDAALRARMARVGREFFFNKFDLEIWLADVAAWLESLGEKKRVAESSLAPRSAPIS